MGSDLKAVTASLRQSLGGAEGQQRLDEIIENIRAALRRPARDGRGQPRERRRHDRPTSARSRRRSRPSCRARREDQRAGRPRRQRGRGEPRQPRRVASPTSRTSRPSCAISADNLNEISGKIARGEGIDRQARQRRDDRRQPQLHAQVRRERRGEPEEHDRPRRALAPRHQPPRRRRCRSSTDNNSRSAFGLDLHTTDRRFFRLEFVDSPFGTRRARAPRPSRSPTPTATARRRSRDATKTTDTHTVNAQVGYHFRNDFTLRAGLFESKRRRRHRQALLEEQAPPHPRGVRLQPRRPSRRTSASRAGTSSTQNLFAFAGWDDPTWSERSLGAVRRRRDLGRRGRQVPARDRRRRPARADDGSRGRHLRVHRLRPALAASGSAAARRAAAGTPSSRFPASCAPARSAPSVAEPVPLSAAELADAPRGPDRHRRPRPRARRRPRPRLGGPARRRARRRQVDAAAPGRRAAARPRARSSTSAPRSPPGRSRCARSGWAASSDHVLLLAEPVRRGGGRGGAAG